jgi:hypothetical protein
MDVPIRTYAGYGIPTSPGRSNPVFWRKTQETIPTRGEINNQETPIKDFL